jgi:predicted ATP-grasp superfamily ATP-dependent carboligase
VISSRSAAAKRRVLVTDGNNRAALAITRSLGRAGHTVIVGDRRPSGIAQASRYCAERVVYPDPAKHEAEFAESLAAEITRREIDAVLPVSDVPTIILSERRDLFEPACAVLAPGATAVMRAADKGEMVRLARRLGVPVPRTIFLDRRSDLDGLLPELEFPIVIKPHRSRVRTPEGWLFTSVRYATSARELTADVGKRHDAEFPLLLQEFVSGYGMGVFACWRGNASVAWFSHRRLREKPPSGGVSVLSESIALSPAAQGYTEALLSELRWCGVAMAEFKVGRDGTPRLMEINGRFWGSLQLAIDAGVDFPVLLLELASGRPTPPPPTYRVGVKSRWLWGDVDSLLIGLRRGPQASGGRGRLTQVAQFMKLWSPGLVYENPRLSDLRPWLEETAQWMWMRRSA